MDILKIVRLAVILLAAGSGSLVLAQEVGPPARGSSEVGNFGDVPFANPQILITRAEDRATWRQLERRELEDKYDKEWRVLRTRQSNEREQALKGFAR